MDNPNFFIPKPEIEESPELCLFCSVQVLKIPLPIRVRAYVGGNTTVSKWVCCDDCADKKLKIPNERVKFIRLLTSFKRYNKVYQWDKEATIVFCNYLVQEGVKIRDYGIRIDWKWSNNKYLEHGLMDLIKLHKIKETDYA